MDPSLQQRIRERAYEIWNAAGCIDGYAEQHWLTAEREVLADLIAQSQPAKTVAARKRRRRATPTAETPSAQTTSADAPSAHAPTK